MNRYKVSLAFLLMTLLTSCASGPWWPKYNPDVLLDAPNVTVISLPPNEFRYDAGMNKAETAPAKLPKNLFRDLATIQAKVYMTNMDFSFINDFQPEWKTLIEKGIADKGNALIFFNSRPREYYHVAFNVHSAEGKKKYIKFMRALTSRFADAIVAADPNGDRQLMEVYANGVSEYKRYGIVVLYDDKQVDCLWLESKKIGRRTFNY
jgi:hypothetical protein